MKYTLLKTATATAKKNGLELFKNANKRNFLLDLSLLAELTEAEGVPEGFREYARVEAKKDLSVLSDFSLVTYEPSDSERINAKIYFKIYTINTEEKNNIYKICQAVKIEYHHGKIDRWTGEKAVINEFTKTIGTDYRPEHIEI